MQNTPLQDPFVLQLQSALRDPAIRQLAPVGARTKCALIPRSALGETEVTLMELGDYSGIVAYDPSEFLISARAGTKISELQTTLSANGQYLPFDPLFSSQGATLGGTIASGISGPDRLLYGGIRDFVMELAMLDGLGNFVRGGGKVVKNAAGFDTPKMMVGSCGRLGIILEITLKVFPSPQATRTIVFDNSSAQNATELCQRILSKPFPIAGMDFTPENELVVRLSGPDGALQAAVERIEVLADRRARHLTNQQHLARRQTLDQWLHSVSPEQVLVRIALPPSGAVSLNRLLNDAGHRDFLFCAGGCTVWVKLRLDELSQLSQLLLQQKLSGLVVRGDVDEPAIGDLSWQQMAARIQRATDPQSKFKAWKPR